MSRPKKKAKKKSPPPPRVEKVWSGGHLVSIYNGICVPECPAHGGLISDLLDAIFG